MKAKIAGSLGFAAIAFGLAVAPLPNQTSAAAATVHTLAPRGVKPLTLRRVDAKPTFPPGHPLGPRHFFGMIVAINGGILSVKRRSGVVTAVDATTAIANGDYSYPLFVGKFVAVDGTRSGATFTAVHVEAITTLKSLENDAY
jgi:hypothetical protein